MRARVGSGMLFAQRGQHGPVGERHAAYRVEEDRIVRQSEVSRPDKVRNAVTLIYASVGINTVSVFMEAPRLSASVALPNMAVVSAGLLIDCLVALCVWRGRNWARIYFLVFLIIGMSFQVLSLPIALATKPVVGTLGIAAAALRLVTVILLFQEPSSAWFKEMKALRSQI